MKYSDLSDREKLLIPQYRFGSIFEITPDILRKIGAEAVGLDIDNTIVPDGRYKYPEGINEWIDSIRSAGLPITVISNGNIIRVSLICRHLGGLPFIHLAKKPHPRGLYKAAERMNVDVTHLAMLGDQLTSDIKAANRCGAIAVRVDPVPEKSLYPHYYARKAIREELYLDIFEAEIKKNYPI